MIDFADLGMSFMDQAYQNTVDDEMLSVGEIQEIELFQPLTNEQNVYETRTVVDAAMDDSR